MTLTEALDQLFKGKTPDYSDWSNPIRPYSIAGVTQSPYKAYKQLKPEYQALIIQWIGHNPKINEI